MILRNDIDLFFLSLLIGEWRFERELELRVISDLRSEISNGHQPARDRRRLQMKLQIAGDYTT
jgi:hypothetical protein